MVGTRGRLHDGPVHLIQRLDNWVELGSARLGEQVKTFLPI